MQATTFVLTAGNSFLIESSMFVTQFSIVGLSDTTTFSYLASGQMVDHSGNPITPAAITFTGQAVYNSKPSSSPANGWTEITISCGLGSVGIELLQN